MPASSSDVGKSIYNEACLLSPFLFCSGARSNPKKKYNSIFLLVFMRMLLLLLLLMHFIFFPVLHLLVSCIYLSSICYNVHIFMLTDTSPFIERGEEGCARSS